ncbi:aminoacylase-1A-like [Leptopilina boulardi]|uniref:aminoacylase-1A-like n=1 Tax=Leptopilina boulardi TaxID=63433 RepID=UPI0021F66370|nr:aminoacylase-1A-like [Leptopilina boulardi]
MCIEIKYLFILVVIINTFINNQGEITQSELDKIAIENFRNYLRIPSVQPNINYEKCLNFIKSQAKSLGLPVKIIEVSPKKPVAIITWEGTEPEKSSIMLNGHMDVVPVVESEWKYPPFNATMDENGNIYARGAQDMKSTSIQYLEAIRQLKLNNVRLNRTIHVTFVPDEEFGDPGMEYFVKSPEFQSMNVGFALDEGLANENSQFSLYYGERTILQIWVNCPGEAGHASILANDTAAEKLRIVIDRFMDFRTSEKLKLNDPNVDPGDVTSVNLSRLKGGIQDNVLPQELSAMFDIRVTPSRNLTEFEKLIESWLKEAGEGVNYTTIYRGTPVQSTKLDNNNIFWIAFQKAASELNMKYVTRIFQGATDIRYLRELGIPALGFSTMINTPILLHASNEYLNKDIFLNGIGIYMKIISAIANA